MKIVEISARKNMLKLDNAVTTSWYKINSEDTPALELVKTLAVGDNVDIKFTVTNGVSVVSQLDKTDSPATPVVKEEETMEETKVKEEVKAEIGGGNNYEKVVEELTKELTKYACTKCGKAMKDDKYEMCYTCNQADWKAKNTDGGSDKNISIQKQTIGKMTSVTVAAIVANTTMTVEETLNVIDLVYDKYTEKVS